METAINIGYSCKLLNKHMNIFIVNEVKPKKIRSELANLLSQQNVTKQGRENAVVVSGDTLTSIFEMKDVSFLKMFTDLCENANVVLACRVSPKQKAKVVTMMRERNPDKSTLAIGDGANDVNMITAAHIGIGIKGLEGTQAARAADYSIGQFKFLKNLLLCHGRECYRRNAYAISYMFYKNVFLVFPIWIFGFVSFFSGTTIYDVFLYNTYNTVFTSLPIVWFSVFDWQFDKQYLLDNPRQYKIGLENIFFNSWVFWRWFFYGLWQGTLLVLLTFYTMHSSTTNEGNAIGCLETDGQFVFSAIVIVVNLKVLVSSYEFTVLSVMASLIGIMSYIAVLAVFGFVDIYTMQGDFQHLFLTSP